jgi:sensor c-di-GMP phosphodiesterase-like protein
MKNKVLTTVGGLIATAVIAAAVAGSLLVADQLSLRDQKAQAGRLAEQVLARNERISDQVRDALIHMGEAKFSNPCSEAARRLMSRIALRSSLIQALAWVKDDKIVCASVDLQDVDIGRVDFNLSEGAAVRASRHLPIDPTATFRITEALASGYAVVVNTDLAFDVLPEGSDAAVGIVGTISGQPISWQGTWQPAWLSKLQGHAPVEFFDGRYVVALRDSGEYDYFAYAALPARRLQEAWTSTTLIAVPIALMAGALVALLIFFLLRQQLGLPSLLKSALRSNRQLYLLYQPFVDMETGRWVGAEALMRWRRPNGEIVSPDIFIPIAERYGLVRELTRKLTQMVRRDMDELLRQHPEFFVSINVASEDLMDEGFAQHLSAMVREWGVDPLQIRLEATERTLIDAKAARPAIGRLQALGHRIALDDFGTGYSSLSYLATLQVNSIKIDKTFVEIIGTDSVSAQVVPHIIEMGKALGLRMIGEGIETEAQAAYLKEHGVQYGQGWLYARPLNPQDLSDALQRQAQAKASPAAPPPVA